MLKCFLLTFDVLYLIHQTNSNKQKQTVMKKYQTLSQLLNQAYSIAAAQDDHLPFGDENDALRDLKNYLANAIDEAEYLETNHNGPFN